MLKIDSVQVGSVDPFTLLVTVSGYASSPHTRVHTLDQYTAPTFFRRHGLPLNKPVDLAVFTGMPYVYEVPVPYLAFAEEFKAAQKAVYEFNERWEGQVLEPTASAQYADILEMHNILLGLLVAVTVAMEEVV